MTRYIMAGLATLIIIQLLFISSLTNQREDLRATIGQLNDDVAELVADAALLNKTIIATQELDKKYNEELTDAKANIDKLRDDLRSNAKRVYVNAACPPTVQTASSASSVADATRIRLGGDATEDYLRLRRELEEDRVKIEGLQEYITNICMRSNNG